MVRQARRAKGEPCEEMWARSVVEAHARVTLDPNDDGSVNEMVDYNVFDRPSTDLTRQQLGILEVGTITNSDFKVSEATFKKELGDGFDDSSLEGTWLVFLAYGARLKPVRERLVPVLRALEQHDIETLRPGYQRDPHLQQLALQLAEVGGVISVERHRDPCPAQVLCSFQWSTVGPTDPLVTLEMVEEWLARSDKDQKGIRRKVGLRDGQPYGGLFLRIEKVPSPVVGTAFSNDYQHYTEPLRARQLPPREPTLPAEITHLWLMAEDGFGWYWDSVRWHVVEHSEGGA